MTYDAYSIELGRTDRGWRAGVYNDDEALVATVEAPTVERLMAKVADAITAAQPRPEAVRA